MDELRNLVIILPALGAIAVSLTCFIYNYPYNHIKDKFRIVMDEFGKVQVMVRTTLTIFYGIIIFMLIIIVIALPVSANNQYNNINRLYLFWIIFLVIISSLVLILYRWFNNDIYNRILKGKRKLKKKIIITGSIEIILTIFFSIFTFTMYRYIYGSTIELNLNDQRIFVQNDKVIKLDTKHNNIQMDVNNNKVNLCNNNNPNLKSLKINIDDKKLVFFVDKNFVFTKDDNIKLKTNNKVIAEVTYGKYNYWRKIQYYSPYLICYLLIAFTLGIMCIDLKISSLKKCMIHCSDFDTIGQIWFEYKDFYWVKTDKDYIYISKKEVKQLIVLDNIEHSKLKI
ncbi:hypothetical protein [Clostridium botulinum]|uniref:hypothetical protein n=1 Tax=Clostridium botulinum TaxID=1491 RepID=UPI0002EAF7D6|nr:hypothetical protein [Clostridium botulinum]KEI92635.1 hypothetical protein N491_12560 [Clostridium botulinum B2 275]NFB16225.1 hypothetical protein [Clostridium botulinum]NFB67111.1 hypothetical protein [Clostridium botulinum]NFB96700.1 hypothetical protein [Clostridium botulinum]NFC57399.1 hypothetical protein [Clostridium botulinum]